jgi:hypothetical protein
MKAGRILPLAIFVLVLVLAWMIIGRSSGYLQGASWQTLYETDCYNASYDAGYQGIKTDAEAQAACDANPGCKGAARHAGGDWWLLSEVATRKKAPIGNRCIIKPVWQTLDATDCYNASYNAGYQGVKTDAEAQAACNANPGCKGAVRHPGGDWWLLSSVVTRNPAPPGNKCIIKP